MFLNSQHFRVRGHARARKWDQDKLKARIQDEINLHNQEKMVISANRIEVVQRT
jgi:hypothetical protein